MVEVGICELDWYLPQSELMIVLFLLAIGTVLSAPLNAPVPIVVMHGISASVAAIEPMAQLIEKHTGAFVYRMEIGNGKWDSFMSINKQVEIFCQKARSVPELAGGFNLVAVSQGGLIGRGYIERCNSPPVKNFVSYVSPQAGISGIPVVEPWCDAVFHNSSLCYTIDHFFDTFVYTGEAQNLLSFAGYWMDPDRYATYVKQSSFLADLDNLRDTKNVTYKGHMLGLHSLTLVHRPAIAHLPCPIISLLHALRPSYRSNRTVDTTLVPRESSAWANYKIGQWKIIVPLVETDMYKEDWIGLRTLNESGRMKWLTNALPHDDQSSSAFNTWFVNNCMEYLKRN